MIMSYTSPLGRVQLPRKNNNEYTGNIIPEKIRLADGREFLVRDLIGRAREKVSYNLQKPNSRMPVGGNVKYTIEERLWMCEATVEQVAERYGISKTKANSIMVRYKRELNWRAMQQHKIIYSED